MDGKEPAGHGGTGDWVDVPISLLELATRNGVPREDHVPFKATHTGAARWAGIELQSVVVDRVNHRADDV